VVEATPHMRMPQPMRFPSAAWTTTARPATRRVDLSVTGVQSGDCIARRGARSGALLRVPLARRCDINIRSGAGREQGK